MAAREVRGVLVEPAANPRTTQHRARVLMFTSLFHPVIGGSEGQAQALAQALIRRGHAVAVVTQKLPRLPSYEVVAGIAVYREIRPVGRRSIVYGISYALSSALALLRHRRQSQIIHVHHLYLDAFSAGLLGPIMRRPVIAKVACGGYVGDIARLKRTRLAGLLFAVTRRVDRIVAISSQIQGELINHSFARERIIRIPNGVDTNRFRPARDREAAKRVLGLQGKIVSFIGRLDPQKGLHHLLDAWSAVVAQRPDARLLLLGTGPQEAELMRLAEELRVSRSVDFLGYREDVRPYLQATDVFVLPSLAEGMSNVLLEAMASGLACVATRIGGNTDLVEDDVNGVLVEPADGAGLANAILRLVQSDADAARLGVAARERVERELSIEVIADRYVQLYRELLAAEG